MVEACGYVPIALSGNDYVELLPAEWRVVNDYGIRIKNRTYDSPELGPMRRQDSGVRAKRGLWEVHRDPYDVCRIWVRTHRCDGEWVPATWKFLNRVPVPFGDLAWDHISHQLPRASEAEIADAVADLLTRAHAGPQTEPGPKPGKRDRRVAARTKAAGPLTPASVAGPQEEPGEEADEGADSLAEVIPLGLFDPLEDPWKRS